jgi:hypothetical protein
VRHTTAPEVDEEIDLMKRYYLSLAALVSLLAACAGQPTSPSSAADTTPSAAATATTELPADALEGTWTTDEMSREELQQAALDAGFSDAEVAAFFAAGLGDPSSAALQIRFLGGHASQFMTPAGEGAIPQHDGPYRLTDDDILVWTDEDCDTTVAFELEGDVLSFADIVDDECPATDSQIAHITFLLSAPYARTD